MNRESASKLISSLPSEGLGFLLGTPGSGKTNLLCDLIVAISETTGKKILYVTEDSYMLNLAKRLVKLGLNPENSDTFFTDAIENVPNLEEYDYIFFDKHCDNISIKDFDQLRNSRPSNSLWIQVMTTIHCYWNCDSWGMVMLMTESDLLICINESEVRVLQRNAPTSGFALEE